MSVNGMPDRALPILEKAEATSRKAGREPALQLMIAKVRALATLSEPDRAKFQTQLATLAQATLDDARRKQTPGAQSEVLNLWAKLLIERRSYSDAELLAKEALTIARNAALPRAEAQALLLLSQIYRQTGRAAAADQSITQAIAALQRIEEPYDLPRYIAEQAEVRAALGALNDADKLYSQAADLIEGLLVNAPSSMVKSSMVAALGEIYVGHFRLAVERLYEPARAFAILESARGRVLYDSMRYAKRVKPQAANSAVEREISRLQRALLHDRLTPVRTRRVLTQLDAAYDRLNPIEYERARAEMTMLRGTPVSVPNLRRRLASGEAFVQYLLDANGSYALRLTRSGLTVHKLPSRREFSQLARQFVTAVKAKQSPVGSAQGLYNLAVAPFLTTDITSLTIVPDGPLHLVPFAALVDEQGVPLNAKVALTSAPSATVYTLLKATRRTVASRPFLGVAFSPDQKGAASGAGTRGIFDVRGANLTPLPFGREEIQEAAAALGAGSVVLAGAAGSEAGLKTQPLQSFRVVHLAAHGVSNEREPDRAALVLAPGSALEDGLWQSREIRETRLNADVVVLSACETGTGRLQGQEGVMNLARTFLTAGARSVVASLWSVDDRSTATLMGMFYEHLAKGATVRESLRQAQLQFVKAYGAKATPYHWAGFEVIGDGAQRITNETTTTN
jgi:CHAT domain-containing protein